MKKFEANPFEIQKDTHQRQQEENHSLELITPELLQQQVRLPEDQWSETFRRLVEEKSRENQQEINEDHERETEESLEALQERTFKRYMEGLGLCEESLRGKRIVDLGSGDGEFVKSLIEKGITSEAYGLDAGVDESAVEERFKNHIVQGYFEEDLPVNDIDYVVSFGAVTDQIWGGTELGDIGLIVEKSLASLKEDGEIRMFPIQEPAQATPLKGIQASQEKWKELLTQISATQNVECKIEPRKIKVCGTYNDIILESVLIIRRKKD